MMVCVSVWYNHSHEIDRFRVEGHSGYGKRGQDIVCAAVSTLVQTTVLGLDNHLHLPLVVDVQDGLVDCRIQSFAGRNQEAMAILTTMMIGLCEIRSQYRSTIKIRTFGGEFE